MLDKHEVIEERCFKKSNSPYLFKNNVEKLDSQAAWLHFRGTRYLIWQADNKKQNLKISEYNLIEFWQMWHTLTHLKKWCCPLSLENYFRRHRWSYSFDKTIKSFVFVDISFIKYSVYCFSSSIMKRIGSIKLSKSLTKQ